MKRNRLVLILSMVVIITLMIMALPQTIVQANPVLLVNPGFETGDFTGWSQGTVSEGVNVVGADGYETPPEGSYMARLGAAAGQNTPQPKGPNQIYQNFNASGPSLSFVYNIHTWDYTGYNHFEYQLMATDTSEIIASYSQGSWGNNEGYKSTGWRRVTLDISGYTGRQLQLMIECGGTEDTSLHTWAYIDVTAPVTPSKVEEELPIGGSLTITKEITTPPITGDVRWEVYSESGLTVTLSPGSYTGVSGGSLLTFQEVITVADLMSLQGATLDGYVDFIIMSEQEGEISFGHQTIKIFASGADLKITKEDSPDPVRRGIDLSYHLEVINNGLSRCPDVVVNENLPAGVTFKSAVASKGVYDETAGTWTIGDMAALDSEELDIVVNVDVSTPPGTLTNRAEAYSTNRDWYDPDIDDNRVTETTTVMGYALGGEVRPVDRSGLLAHWIIPAGLLLAAGLLFAGMQVRRKRLDR